MREEDYIFDYFQRYYPADKRYEIISVEDRFRIQGLLVQWLSNKGLRHDIDVGK